MKKLLPLFLLFLSFNSAAQQLHLYQQRYTSTSFTVYNVNALCYGSGLKMYINGAEHTDFHYGYCGGGICQFRFPFGYLKVGDVLTVKDACGNTTPPVTVTDDYVYVEVPGGASYPGNGIGSHDETLPYSRLSSYLNVGKCEPVNINSHALHRIGLMVASTSSNYTTGVYKINGSPITSGTFDIDKLGITSTTMTVNANGSITANGAADLFSYASWSGQTPLSLEYTHNGQSDKNEFFVGPLSVQFLNNSSILIKQFNYDGSEDIQNLTGNFSSSKFLFTFNEGTFKLFIDGVERKSINRTVIYSASSGSLSNGGLLPYTTGVTWTPGASGNQWVQAIIDGIRVVRQNFYVAQDMVINETVTNVGCSGGSNGSITLNVTGGQAPLQYSTDNIFFSSNTTLGGLSAGNYTVYVRDASGCSAQKTISVGENPVMNVSGSITQQLSCLDGADARVTLSASGGAGFYQYSADDVTYGNQAAFNGLSAGTKTFYIRDAAGCKKSVELTLHPQSRLLAVTQVSAVLCHGDPTGTITVDASASAPAGGLQYALGSAAFQSSASFTGLSSGVYTVTVKDDLCQITLPGITVSQPSPLGVTAAVNHHVLCYGDSTGSVAVNTTGGVGGYSYSTNALNYTAAAAGITLDTLSMGNFKIRVKDANGCGAESNIVTLTQPPLLQLAVDASVNIKCYGESTGSITLLASGGTPAYQYQLGGGSLQASTSFGGLNAGPKSFTVQDAHGCTAAVSTTLLQPAAALNAALAGSSNLVCNSDHSGRLEFAASGGTLPYQYSLSGSPYQSSAVFTGLAAGGYTLQVRDGNACAFTLGSLTLTEPTPIRISMLKKEDVNCLEYSRGEALVQADGSNGGFSYRLWGKDFQFNPIADISNTTGHFINLKAGDYRVTATDVRGCQEDYTVTIIPKSTNITFDISKNLPTACDQNNGSISIMNTQGGRQPYSYSISTLQGVQNTPDFGSLYNGSYIVTVSDSLCSYKKEVDLSLPGSLKAGHTIYPISCNVADANLEVNPITGGNGNYQLSLSGSAYGPERTFSHLSPNVYAVFIKDQPQSCITVLSVEIKEQNRADIQVTHTQNIDCFGNASGSISVAGNNNMAPFTYAINNGGFGSGNTFSSLTTGQYIMRAMNRLGCQDSIRVTLTQPPLLESTVTKKDNLCFDDNTGELDVQAWGGVAPYTYTINKADYQADTHFGKLKAGGYELTVKDDHACLVSKSIQLIQPEKLELRPMYTDTVRCYGEKNGVVTVEAWGGTPAYSFSKDSVSFFGSPVFDQLAAGDYTFYITDQHQCTHKASLTLTQPELLVLSLTSKADPLCAGEANGKINVISTGGNGGNTYYRDNIFDQKNGLFTGLSQGEYSFKVTDRRGCEDTVSLVKLLWPRALSAELSTVSPVCAGDANAAISLEVSGGVGGYGVYLADSTLAQFTNGSYAFSSLPAGAYEIRVKDANGCRLTLPTRISEAEPLNPIRFPAQNEFCRGQEVMLESGNPDKKVVWTFNGQPIESIRHTITVKEAGTYGLTVSNATGCSINGSYTLKHNSNLMEADFLMTVEAFVADTVYALDISRPAPDQILWKLPGEARSIQHSNTDMTFRIDQPGVYTIEMLAIKGDCENRKVREIKIFTKEDIGSTNDSLYFQEYDILQSIAVAPNPNFGKFTLKVKLSKSQDIHVRLVRSSNAMLMYEEKFTGQKDYEEDIKITNFIQDTYILTVQSGNAVLTTKVLLLN